MKNKTLVILFCIIFFFSNFNKLLSDDFIFESTSIEINKEENIVIAKDGVLINSNDNLEITSDRASYFKEKKLLKLRGNVIIKDNNQNIIIRSENIDYEKNIEKIISKNDTKIDIEDDFIIEGKNINFFRLEKIVKSKDPVKLTDKFKNKINAINFDYEIEKKRFISNQMTFTDQDLNNYKTKEAFIDLKDNKIAAKDIEIYFADGELGSNARLKGRSMYSENNISIIKNGVFTTCEIRDGCPPWALKASEIKHDKSKKTIYYKNSWLELYDKPVFYFPKFFHPDPTVNRQSGFLTPSILESSVNSSSVQIPYYKVISDNKDLTISPRFYQNNDFMIQNEYRQIEKNTNFITDFSFKKFDNFSKSHVFANSKSLIENDFSYSDLEINLEKTSSDTYLKSDDIKTDTREANNQSLLNSFIRFNAYNEDLKIFSEIGVFEDLTKEKDSDKHQFILPNFTISKMINTELDLKGNLNYIISGSNQKKNTNVNEKYLINDLVYKSNSIFSQIGTNSNFEFFFKNSTKEGKNSSNYDNDAKSENYLSLSFKSTLPLKKKFSNYVSNLTPKLLARYSPTQSENMVNDDKKINITNIFSNNRLGLNDSLEGGESLTLGFDFDLKDLDNRDFLGFSLGQIFRDKEDKRLPITSKIRDKSSDIVGNFNFTPNDHFKFDYDFSFDNNLDTANYNKFETKLSINNFITSFEFLEENNEIGSESYLTTDASYFFNSKNSLSYSTRRNRKTNLTEFYNLIYEYRNDCLVAAIEYNKDYYQDRDLKPSEEIFFSISFVPFTSVNSPNIK
tara:strand:- start:1788 stop:4169 length:2382 start_codon:yes stop_codon:yes gene_type:complete